MGLQQDIIIVNEFSVPTPKGGSRGGTPGNYVMGYMARSDAVEPLAPIQRRRTDDFILRYMAREQAVERAESPTGAKKDMRRAQGMGGLAFGYGSISLSDEQLRAAATDIQRHFESGKTVLKTVLSFDEDYLKRHGIVDQDFHCRRRGDYRGNIDQMKLRMGIMHGMDRMAAGPNGFDDLHYVVTIQVDTEHVHAHISAVDAGKGHLTPDGTQRGKLDARHRSRLRRGVDSFLDEKQAVAQLSSAVGYERRNVTTYIKRWAHERIRSEALPQFIFACLPSDRSLWRAGSNSDQMRKANRLVTELVTEQLGRPDSPMPAAMEKVTDYANNRRKNEGLSTDQWQKLVDAGRGQIMERATNGVYQLLRATPAKELAVRTPMLEVMSMDYERMAVLAADDHQSDQDEDDLVSFGFRLRSYSSRLRHHREESGRHRDLAKQWEKADAADVAPEDSRPLYAFHRFETDYHRRVMSKYQHFLPLLADASAWQDSQQRISDYGSRLLGLMSLRADASLARMKDPDEAEQLGRAIYDQPGGRHLSAGRTGKAILDGRITTMKKTYDERVEDLRSQLSGAGLVLDLGVDDSDGEQITDQARITPGVEDDFAEVKALDLHHLGYDFAHDVELGQTALTGFLDAAHERRQLLLGAMDYLEGSGQSAAIADLPVEDVAAMTRMARQLRAQRGQDEPIVLPSRIAQLREEVSEREAVQRSRASSLDAELAVRVSARVDQAVLEAPDHSVGALGESGPDLAKE